MNAVACAGIDHDGCQGRSAPDGRDPDAVVDDADRFGDGHLAIAGGVEQISPPALVRVSAKAKVRQGAVSEQVPLFVPCPETQVRFGPACAGAAKRPKAISGPAMVGNDVILIMICPPSNAKRSPIFGRVPRATHPKQWGEVRA